MKITNQDIMKSNAIISFVRIARQSAMTFVLMFALLASPLLTSCTENSEEKPEGEKVEGVILPLNTSSSLGANGGMLKFVITTDAGYQLDVSDKNMLTFAANAYSKQAGTYNISLKVSRNITGAERRGEVYITVDGYSRIKLFEVIQATGSMDEVTKWVDERLQNEYYWLDEYKQKLTSFDWSLSYDKYLSSSLMGLTTNMEDGGVNSDGSRYIYSYISKTGTTSGASSKTRAEDRNVRGYGILLASTVWSYTDTSYAFAVEHIYPNSPAAAAGLKRGDIISHINGSEIPKSTIELNAMWSQINNNEGSSITIKGETFDEELNDYKVYEYTLAAASYEESAVAYCGVVEFDEQTAAEVNPNGEKKIGYLAYLSFDNRFDNRLIEAFENLASQGITDLILDLRHNGGGSVNSSIMLASMILPESYVGKTYATLVRNPKNTRITENDECLILRNGIGEHSIKDLPNLNLEKVWVITSANTASASEMVIKGLEGLDVEVKMVGKKTEGKNCGMDVISNYTIGTNIYEYAPITFINQNGKGDSNYADGITPSVNLQKYVLLSGEENSVQRACRIFPAPDADWADVQRDLALYEAALQICGYSILENGGGSGAVAKGFKPVGGAVTRAGGRSLSTVETPDVLRSKVVGATLTAEEREDLMAVSR